MGSWKEVEWNKTNNIDIVFLQTLNNDVTGYIIHVHNIHWCASWLNIKTRLQTASCELYLKEQVVMCIHWNTNSSKNISVMHKSTCKFTSSPAFAPLHTRPNHINSQELYKTEPVAKFKLQIKLFSLNICRSTGLYVYCQGVPNWPYNNFRKGKQLFSIKMHLDVA